MKVGECIWVVVKMMRPFLDPYYNTAPNIWGTPKGTIIETSTHIFGVQF